MNNNEINLSELRKQMAEDRRAAELKDETYVAGSGWMDSLKPNSSTVVVSKSSDTIIYTPDPVPLSVDDTVSVETALSGIDGKPEIDNTTYNAPPKKEEYSGPGLVIDNKPKGEPIVFGELPPSILESVSAYMGEMDKAIERVQAENEALKEAHEEEPEYEDVTEDIQDVTPSEASFDEKYDEAVVVIDKLGVGSVVNFTPEEHDKLEKVKSIKLEEVETIQLSTYATKKVRDKKAFKKIVKSINTMYSTQICLPLSGYTATIRGCSAYELLGLINTTNDALIDTRSKWSLIHSKIESTSIGDMDFNEFLFNTAASDYENFIYGLLCATYPDEDTVSLKCPNCGKSHPHSYTVRSLIRAELMSDELKEQFAHIIDSSASLTTAVEAHDNSPVKQVVGIKLPCSGMLVELHVQSAYDFINNSVKSVVDDEDSNARWRDAVVMATLIRRILVDDPDDPEVPFEITNTKDIAEIIFNLNTTDIRVIKKYGEKLISNMNIEYGFMKVHCDVCGEDYDSLSISPESLLFRRYHQDLNQGLD